MYKLVLLDRYPITADQGSKQQLLKFANVAGFNPSHAMLDFLCSHMCCKYDIAFGIIVPWPTRKSFVWLPAHKNILKIP